MIHLILVVHFKLIFESFQRYVSLDFVKQDIIACINYYNIVKVYRTQISFKNLKFIIVSSA